jgi:hypothetical protein
MLFNMAKRKFSSGLSSARLQKTKVDRDEEWVLSDGLGGVNIGEDENDNSSVATDIGKLTKHVHKSITINTKIQKDIEKLIKNKRGNTKATLESIKLLLQESNRFNNEFLKQFNYNVNSLANDTFTEREAIEKARTLHKEILESQALAPYGSGLEEVLRERYTNEMNEIAKKTGLSIKELLDISGLLRRFTSETQGNKQERFFIGLLLKGYETEELFHRNLSIYGITITKFDEIKGYIIDCYKSNQRIDENIGRSIARSSIGFGESLDILNFTLDQIPKIYCYAKRFSQKIMGTRGGFRLYALVLFSTTEIKRIDEFFLEDLIRKLKNNWDKKEEIIEEGYKVIF